MPLRQVTMSALLSIGLIVPAAAQDFSMSSVDQANFSRPSDQSAEWNVMVLKTQVLLDATYFSPDGIGGQLRQQSLLRYRGFQAALNHAAGAPIVVFRSALSRRAGRRR